MSTGTEIKTLQFNGVEYIKVSDVMLLLQNFDRDGKNLQQFITSIAETFRIAPTAIREIPL